MDWTLIRTNIDNRLGRLTDALFQMAGGEDHDVLADNGRSVLGILPTIDERVCDKAVRLWFCRITPWASPDQEGVLSRVSSGVHHRCLKVGQVFKVREESNEEAFDRREPFELCCGCCGGIVEIVDNHDGVLDVVLHNASDVLGTESDEVIVPRCMNILQEVPSTTALRVLAGLGRTTIFCCKILYVSESKTKVSVASVKPVPALDQTKKTPSVAVWSK